MTAMRGLFKAVAAEFRRMMNKLREIRQVARAIDKTG
jgi:hypothetical protein